MKPIRPITPGGFNATPEDKKRLNRTREAINKTRKLTNDSTFGQGLSEAIEEKTLMDKVADLKELIDEPARVGKYK